MKKAELRSLANFIAVKAAFIREDAYSSAFEKVVAIIQKVDDLSKLSPADLPSGELVPAIQGDIKGDSGILVEYGLIMFTLQNLLDIYFNPDFKSTIQLIFNSVSDIRDHRYRYGKCHCYSCGG